MNMYSQLKFIDRNKHTHVLRCDYFHKNTLFLANYLTQLLNEEKITPEDLTYLAKKLQEFIQQEKELYK